MGSRESLSNQALTWGPWKLREFWIWPLYAKGFATDACPPPWRFRELRSPSHNLWLRWETLQEIASVQWSGNWIYLAMVRLAIVQNQFQNWDHTDNSGKTISRTTSAAMPAQYEYPTAHYNIICLGFRMGQRYLWMISFSFHGSVLSGHYMPGVTNLRYNCSASVDDIVTYPREHRQLTWPYSRSPASASQYVQLGKGSMRDGKGICRENESQQA